MEAATTPSPAAATGRLSAPPRRRGLDRPLAIAVAAAALGVLGDALLRPQPWGLGAALWFALAAAAVAATGRWAAPAAWSGWGWWWAAVPPALAGTGLAWRDSPALGLLDGGLALLALGWLVAPAATQGTFRRRFLRRSGLDYAVAAAAAGWHGAVGALFALAGGVDVVQRRGGTEGGGPRPVWRRQVAAVGRGAALAAVPLLLFGALLATADAVFAGWLRRLVVWDWWDPWRVASHLGLILALAWVAGGALRAVAAGATAPSVDLPAPRSLRLGTIEVGVVLGSLDLLFGLFVLVQFRYLFGGAARVEASTGLTYAEYARRGFFELVAVVALALPFLLLLHWLLRRDEPGTGAADGRPFAFFRLLAGVQIGLLGVVLVSALQRMRLYQQEYGLTELRLYTTAFMGWLALLFVWFAATVLRDRRRPFAAGALAAAVAITAILHAVNPDALIVRANAAAAAEPGARPFDAAYALGLSGDAVPALLAAWPDLPAADRCLVGDRLLEEWATTGEGWRTWSWGRQQARSAVARQASALPCEPGAGRTVDDTAS